MEAKAVEIDLLSEELHTLRVSKWIFCTLCRDNSLTELVFRTKEG